MDVWRVSKKAARVRARGRKEWNAPQPPRRSDDAAARERVGPAIGGRAAGRDDMAWRERPAVAGIVTNGGRASVYRR